MVGLGWVGLVWSGLGSGLGWVLGWAGLEWDGLGSVGLTWVWLRCGRTHVGGWVGGWMGR